MASDTSQKCRFIQTVLREIQVISVFNKVVLGSPTFLHYLVYIEIHIQTFKFIVNVNKNVNKLLSLWYGKYWTIH